MTYVVGGTAALSAAFTVDGVLTDPTDVAVTWRKPDGTIGTAAAVRESEGTYGYDLALDQAGRWGWEFTGTGGAAAGVKSGSLAVGADLIASLDARIVADLSEIEGALRRPMTDAESDDAERLIYQLVDALEIRLNRWLYPRQVTETHRLGTGQRLILRHGPVRSVESITEDGAAVTDPDALAEWEAAAWQEHVDIVFTYTAGDDVTPALTGLVTDVIARTVHAGIAAGSGAIKSYSVEGTSITYGDGVGSGGEGGTGRMTVGDIRSLGRRRRPVLRT